MGDDELTMGVDDDDLALVLSTGSVCGSQKHKIPPLPSAAQQAAKAKVKQFKSVQPCKKLKGDSFWNFCFSGYFGKEWNSVHLWRKGKV